ncbi:LOW QUALITY PROTEIN: CD151 antigen-like [Amphiura filiformis]|uniref:LOW QUALITY PROTEIN: CD151 antigen-like n=1 Tax=Amphiura filiformis TaxID=82378 RepID=UPI003B2148A5
MPDKMEEDLSCTGRCAKNMMFTFNLLFLVSGIMALALGLFIVIFPVSTHVAVLMGNGKFIYAGYILMVAGIAVVVVAFVGCCGAKYENKMLLGGLALIFIFVIELIAGVVALAFYTQAEFYIEDNLEIGVMEQYGLPGEEDLTAAWNYIQWWFECCGFKGNATDAALIYTRSLWYLTSNVRVPESCCTESNNKIVNLQMCQDRQNIDWYTNINNQGCYNVIFGTAIQLSVIIAVVGIVLSIIQFFGMAFSYCLLRRLAG